MFQANDDRKKSSQVREKKKKKKKKSRKLGRQFCENGAQNLCLYSEHVIQVTFFIPFRENHSVSSQVINTLK